MSFGGLNVFDLTVMEAGNIMRPPPVWRHGAAGGGFLQ